MFAVVGVINNRKTNKIKVERSKFLMPGAIISLIIIGVGILFIPIQSVGNLVYIVGYYNGTIPFPPGVTLPEVTVVDVIGAAAQILMLFVFLSVMFIPGYIRTY
jgi:hypothetical protein